MAEVKKLYSVNHIFKALGHDKALFKQWITSEKHQFSTSPYKNAMTFDAWLNQKYEGKNKEYMKKLSADGEAILGKINEGLGKVSEIADKVGVGSNSGSSKDEPTATGGAKGVEKTILGMKPLVFYSVTAVVAVGLTYLGYRIYKSKKN